MQTRQPSSPLLAALLFAALFSAGLACRMQDFVVQFRSTPTPVAIAIAPTDTATPSPTQTIPPTPSQTPTLFLTPTVTNTPLPTPTLEPPTITPSRTPIPPTRVRSPTPTSTITPTPAPTRCPQQYCVVFRGCKPDGDTVAEGVVYNGKEPENGIAVRVALEQGAYPLVPDFISGTERINPGKPDVNNPGHYYLLIVAGAPREGNWWVFIVDKAGGTVQMSEAQFIHTNDTNVPGNCQHAFIDFVR